MKRSVGENIRRIRGLRGMSQKELAEKVGVSNVQINYYEHDARRPKIDTLSRIAEALGKTRCRRKGAFHQRREYPLG